MRDRVETQIGSAADAVPGGAWAIGVSGGGDSVALLELLRERGDLALHVVHLDHETREGESARDAQFVRDLAIARGLAHTIVRRAELESSIRFSLPKNRSSRFRALRLELFRRVVAQHSLAGVLLAHQADDQAETVMQRLLRGSGLGGLTGMAGKTRIAGVTIVRPLLGVRREALREMLRSRGIAWREDASNASPAQQRNRVRALLAAHPQLHDPLIELATACAAVVGWLRTAGPALGESFDVDPVASLPAPVVRDVLRRWLLERGGGRGGGGRESQITPASVERLMQMACDRATPPRQHFPGGILVRRRGGKIFVDETRGTS
jgi:tRNA(Ile)-lysidine synthetase-like protein